MTRSWRDGVAHVEQYAEMGQYRVRSIRDALLCTASVKIVLFPGMRVWHVVVLSVPAYALFYAIGRLYAARGWLRHASTVGVKESLSRPAVVELVQRKRLFDHLGIPWNGIPQEIPREVADVLEVR